MFYARFFTRNIHAKSVGMSFAIRKVALATLRIQNYDLA